ncbi:putative bifunctional diguanylate cyclase/phosphodiesterase [Paenibacillus sp. NPDC056579]|uniref:putative bifunctional diguanylate cyclase/phosphodiesterase n=1 Tax=Paenibacillus sp. NPDC056579 TaxID=3345871 RepID=UPI00369FCCBB
MIQIGLSTIRDVSINASVLLSFIFLFHWLYPFISNLPALRARCIWGGLFGITGLTVMIIPIYVTDGIFIDFRTLLVAFAGAFGGAVSGIIAALIVGIYRIYVGGVGAFSALAAIGTAMLLGMMMSRYDRKFHKPAIAYAGLGLLVAIGNILWLFVLPADTAWLLIREYAVPVLVAFPVAAVLIRYFIVNEIRKRETEDKLLESEEKYRTLAEHSNDLIFSCNEKGIVLSSNKKFQQDLGVLPEELGKKSIVDLFGFHEELSWWNGMLETVKSGQPVTFEKDLEHTDGSVRIYVTTLSPVAGADGQVKSITGTCYDITKIRNTERHIMQLSLYDDLTELPNRKLFMEKLNQAIGTAREQDSMVAVVVVDLDNFKLINDTRGYVFGDELLNRVGLKLQRFLTPKDTLARIGEDEFVFLFEGIDQLQPLQMRIQSMYDGFQYPQLIHNEQIHTKISMGVALYPSDGETAEELVKNADTAMYKVKEQGKNHYRFYNNGMREALIRKSKLEEALRKALIHNELILQYQPQVDVRTEQIRGFESLIRWVHPEMGTISPMEFIPVAEQSGAIIPIGEWVIRTACERNKAIQNYGFPESVISVNISTIQLQRADFARMVIGILLETQMAPEYLELEITESVMMESFQTAISNLETLRDYGVKIALDDFGTGYSSLNYLSRLPIGTLKIDKSFVQDITNESVGESLVESIIELVHRMGIKVVAEGVETEEQYECLRSWGCEYIQGYYISKPLFELEIRQLGAKAGAVHSHSAV